MAFAAGAVWVASADHVSRLDPQTNQVTATIPLPATAERPSPEDLPVNRIDADDQGVWVAIGGNKDIPVVRIDTDTNEILVIVTIKGVGEILRISLCESGVRIM